MMAKLSQNGTPVFDTDPGAYYSFPVSACSQVYPIAKQQPPASGNYNVLAGKTSVIKLGAFLLACGVLSQIGASVAFRFYAKFSEVGAGIWCGYMFMAAGVIAIVAVHHGPKHLIVGTAVTSGLAVVAAITQFTIAVIGLRRDAGSYYSPCYSGYNSAAAAIAANAMMILGASLALVGGVWLLVIGCMAVHSVQMHSTPYQHLHQQHQQLSLNYPNTYAIHPQMPSQFVQMPAQFAPLQAMTTSTIPNEQFYQLPVQLILDALQRHFTEEIRNHQMLSVPIKCVRQDENQHQQPIALNPPPPFNTLHPETQSQPHEQHDAQKN